MSDFMEYKGYLGSVQYCEEDHCFFGKAMSIKSLLAYEGNSPEGLEKMFRQTIDDYLRECQEDGVKPNEPHSEP